MDSTDNQTNSLLFSQVSPVSRITQVMPGAAISRPQKKEAASQTNFKDVLAEKLTQTQALQFSKHASMRLSSRDISLSNEQIKRVEDGISKANTKGIKDSLVLVDNLALVVNVPSKTVITAMDQKQANDNIFTNIDGAVIV